MPRRHSKRKTLLVVLPLIAAIALAGIFGFKLISPFFEKQEIVPGIAVTVTIPSNVGTASQIASILKDEQVIADTQSFLAQARSMNADQYLKSGVYDLETLMDLPTLIGILVAGPIEDGNRLTVPEGLTVEQTARIVEESCGIAQADFLAEVYSAHSYAVDYPFLHDVYNNSLEGFLYPKTYAIPKDADASYVIRVLLDQFVLETKDVDFSVAEARGLNLFHVVTLASLIERETAIDEERPLVSSVIYNRLKDGMKLQIDATVVYALGPSYDGSPLLYVDLEVDSPYNTYLHYELPAGPICSPSIQSIIAAAHPADTNYFYYVLTSKEGYHTFCVTNDEFEVAKEEYLRIFEVPR
ncbi:MAG: endolytic transglycosylase MltG [Coriobacteriia bacterium]|nr:endolytic transglycosylase MltG [Coriobacteriia bacterium]